jgi:TetR/AcrR family transcriptional regulator, mexJK operon transcriptional repressor
MPANRFIVGSVVRLSEDGAAVHLLIGSRTFHFTERFSILSEDAAVQGRPVDPVRHAAILEAARRAFLDLSYERVSMDAIAAAAGVSKVTVYARFGSKDQLFIAAMSAASREIYERARMDAEAGLPLPQLLNRLGLAFVNMLLEPEVMSLWGAMIQARDRAPDLPAKFYETVIERSLETLAAALELAAARGEIVCPEPRRAATQFTSMVQGQFRFQLELGVLGDRDREEVRAYVEDCVSVFVRGLQGAQPASGNQPCR